jgi:hypothetical protein|tara:strand:+ start:1183 stop:1302 length:120 start_codon:yes stop_codon:yes gene_type:complete
MEDKLYKLFEEAINSDMLEKMTEEDLDKLNKIFDSRIYK